LKVALAAAGIAAPKSAVYSLLFPDVPKLSWSAPFVAAGVRAGAVTNSAERDFRPEEPATRAEAVKMIAEIFDLPAPENTSDFFDLPEGHFARGAASALFKKEVASGWLEEVEVKTDEFRLGDRYDFKTARGLGSALAEVGFFGWEQVGDFYTRDLMNALSGYQDARVFSGWNRNFGFPDEKTREILGAEIGRRFSRQEKRLFKPDLPISRAAVAKMVDLLNKTSR
jgi:hypothetical protein